MHVTEKWLGEIGGWQAMKLARELVRTGSVAEVVCESRTFRGLVGSGQRKFRATLTVGQGSNAESKCACPDGQRGVVCAHALAVALASISPPPAAPAAKTPLQSAAGPGKGGGQGRPAAPAAPTIREEDIPAGEFTVYIATDHLRSPSPSVIPAPARPRNTVLVGHGTPRSAPAAPTIPVFLKFQPGGDRKDVPLARWMLQHQLPVQSMPLRLPPADLGGLLGSLSNHPQVEAGMPSAKHNTLALAKTLDTCFVLNSLKIQTQNEWIKDAQTIVFTSSEREWSALDAQKTPWFWSAKRHAFAPLPAELPPAFLCFLAGLLQAGKATQPVRWVVENLAALCQVLEPESDADPLRQLRIIPHQPTYRLRLEGNLRRVEARLAALLPDGTTEATAEAYPVPDPQVPLLFHTRNPAAERAAQRRLEDAGFQGDTRGRYELKGEREILRFLSSDLPRLRREYQVVEGEGWRHVTRGLSIIRPKVRPPGAEPGTAGAGAGAGPGLAPTRDWLSLEVAYEASDGFSLPRSEVLRLIRSGKRDVPGRDGRRYLLDADGCEELEELVQDMESHFEAENRLAVRGRQAEILESFVDRPEILALHTCPPLEPAALKAGLGELGDLLRPYQFEGVRWMERHSRTLGGGILADEMGLGKTVQTLGLLRVLLAGRRAVGSKTGPALVICPTSLLSNWAEEATRFTPELKTHISHDTDRHESLARLSDFDVIFTSYALIVRDLAHYTKLTFSAVILDEASYIRNPDTATAKAVCQLRATCRFALTGTPVENSVRDLWSIFEFIVPRQLPAKDDFHERFVKPLSQADSAQARPVMERLRRLIRPNLLRRTKREVAKDLPEKIEKVLWCELTKAQREVYQRLLDEGREEIRQARRRSGQGSARMTMFTVLLRLRQICNDLRLAGVQGIEKLSPAETSGKWVVLAELLQETLEGGHKALIFSQFVSMLRLVQATVEGRGTPHSYLDGSTRDRAGEVAAFQTDPAKRLFLISLKAGGYGLNLTAADEVILMDPWWNPAVEAQAIDRAHRIGQGRPVTAYRLITRGTVEEKILKLQAQKRAVMDTALEEDATVMTGLTDEDLEAILE